MRHYRYLVHTSGPALWPDHKPLEEVLLLKGTTPAPVWEATYQANPTAPGGQTFKRKWFRERFDATDRRFVNERVGVWISADTALTDKDGSAYTAFVVGEGSPTYQLYIREVWRGRIEFPDLTAEIKSIAQRYRHDGKLRGVVIENKASGISALQTLRASSDEQFARMLIGFIPVGDKEFRANQASVWCKNGSVLLPEPSNAVPWLADFEEEFFGFPSSAYDDQVDAFSQLVIYLENYLATGWRARVG